MRIENPTGSVLTGAGKKITAGVKIQIPNLQHFLQQQKTVEIKTAIRPRKNTKQKAIFVWNKFHLFHCNYATEKAKT